MKIRIILLLLIFIVATNNDGFAHVRLKRNRPKSCIPKVLLPGHDKPIKCNKARRIKNSYF